MKGEHFTPEACRGIVTAVNEKLISLRKIWDIEIKVINEKKARKLKSKVQFDLKIVEEIVEITRYLHDPDDKLAPFQRPAEFAECLARELLHTQYGGTV